LACNAGEPIGIRRWDLEGDRWLMARSERREVAVALPLVDLPAILQLLLHTFRATPCWILEFLIGRDVGTSRAYLSWARCPPGQDEMTNPLTRMS
jgi:hypothetical protein